MITSGSSFWSAGCSSGRERDLDRPGYSRRGRGERMDQPTTEDEWRAKLSPQQYEVLRRSATEPAVTGEDGPTKDEGIYQGGAGGGGRVGSRAKFHSGTG